MLNVKRNRQIIAGHQNVGFCQCAIRPFQGIPPLVSSTGQTASRCHQANPNSRIGCQCLDIPMSKCHEEATWPRSKIPPTCNFSQHTSSVSVQRRILGWQLKYILSIPTM